MFEVVVLTGCCCWIRVGFSESGSDGFEIVVKGVVFVAVVVVVVKTSIMINLKKIKIKKTYLSFNYVVLTSKFIKPHKCITSYTIVSMKKLAWFWAIFFWKFEELKGDKKKEEKWWWRRKSGGGCSGGGGGGEGGGRGREYWESGGDVCDDCW